MKVYEWVTLAVLPNYLLAVVAGAQLALTGGTNAGLHAKKMSDIAANLLDCTPGLKPDFERRGVLR